MYKLYTHNSSEIFPPLSPHTWWRNVCQANSSDIVKIRELLEKNRASCVSNKFGVFGFAIEFETEEDAIMFVLKWS